jgi:hypothetical protein
VNKVPAREGEEKVIQREITCGNLRLTKLPRLEKETARGKRRETAWKQGVIKTSHGKSKESDKKRRKEKDLNPRLGYRKVTTQKKLPSRTICIDEVRSVSSSRANRMLRLRRSFARSRLGRTRRTAALSSTVLSSLISDHFYFRESNIEHPCLRTGVLSQPTLLVSVIITTSW